MDPILDLVERSSEIIDPTLGSTVMFGLNRGRIHVDIVRSFSIVG